MSDVFSPSDHSIIKAFLDRESKMYLWKEGEDGPGREKFVESMFQTLMNFSCQNPAFNYIHIESLSNFGLLNSKLVLSSSHLDPSRDLFICLPPSPKGKISFHIKPSQEN